MVTAIRDAVVSPPHTLGFRPLKKNLFPPCVGVGASLPPQAAAAPAVPADHTAPPVQAGPQPGPSVTLLAQAAAQHQQLFLQQQAAAFMGPQQQAGQKVGLPLTLFNGSRLRHTVFLPGGLSLHSGLLAFLHSDLQ